MRVDPEAFRLRRVSFAFGARAVTAFQSCESSYGWLEGCSVSPWLAATAEAGVPRFSGLAELSSSPVPRFSDDLLGLDIIRVSLGAAFGNERVRGALIASGGYVPYGGEARLTLSPWTSRRDHPRGAHRHGLELSVGWSALWGEATIAYRFVPGGPNHRRAKR
jgi:hypothetical protein